MTKDLPKLVKYLTISLTIVFLSACGARTAVAPAAQMQSSMQDTLPLPPIKLQAVGHGTPGAYTQYTHAQQRLMAMRAAQVDAYRNLAEQVYGFRVWGGSSVSAFTTQNDTVRSYVDTTIRGARLVNMTTIADGNFEATVELDVTPQFYNCLISHGACTTPSANNATAVPSSN